MRRWSIPLRPILSALVIGLSLLAIVGWLAGCGPVLHPRPLPVMPDRTREFADTCADVYRTQLGRDPDQGGLEGCINQARGGKTKDDLIAWIRTSPEYIALHTFHPLPPVTVDGTIFRVNGQPWVFKGFSSFRLMDRWVRGEDITSVLDSYQGFNTAVVFVYTPANVWGDKAWSAPSPDRVVAFVRAMNMKGKYVELVLLTSAGDQYVTQAKAILSALAAVRTTEASNLLIRLGNEPAQQNGPGNPPYTTATLKAAADASGFVYDSGFYAANGSTWFGGPSGGYISPHTGRDAAEWARRGHDCLDITHGAPDAPWLGKKPVPCVLGEPPKPQDVGMTAADAKAYAATGVQFGAGGTFHSATGLQGQPPTPQEAALARAFLVGLNAFPGDTNRGAYRRIDGDGLRTYIVGKTMVRIRPRTPAAPVEGFVSFDPDHVIWLHP